MKIKAAVFDMDGLMFDTERLAMAAWDYAGEKMGLGKAGYMVMKTLGARSSGAMSIPRPCAATAGNSPIIFMNTTKFP